MKYKCIENYWMDGESAEAGNKPAFAKGRTYVFTPSTQGYYVTTNFQKQLHSMSLEELNHSGHFELV